MKKKIMFFVLVLALTFTIPAYALDYDFSGAFTKDNDVVSLNFTVGDTSNVTVFSSSWVSGGFDMMLGIWKSDGTLVFFQDDGENIGSTMSNGVSYNHGTWDSYYTVSNLAAGNYIATVTQYDNFNNGSNLSDGFTYDNNDNFTNDNGYGAQPYFNGVQSYNDPRTGNWAFHLLGVEEASGPGQVPEPASMLLLGLGLAGLAGYRRMKK